MKASAIVVADFDNDGDIDVVIGTRNNGNGMNGDAAAGDGEHFFLNDGSAGFTLVDGALEGEHEAQEYQSVFWNELSRGSTTRGILAVDLDQVGAYDDPRRSSRLCHFVSNTHTMYAWTRMVIWTCYLASLP